MKRFLCFALAAILLLGLVGCDSAPKYEMFYFYEMNDDGVKYSAADLQKDLDAEGQNVQLNDIFYLKLYKNGTAVMCSMGKEENMKYNDTEIWSVNDDTARAAFARTGDSITIRDGAAVITYRKG